MKSAATLFRAHALIASGTLALQSLCVAASLFLLLLLSVGANAQRTDIAGPAGSGTFGSQTVVLPNGNFVVTDPVFDDGATANVGAVYLYNGATLQLISTLKGVTADDNVGFGTIAVLPGGNHFVTFSTNWDIPGGAANVGAVTLCSTTTGCSGTVTAANSLTGTTGGDQLGVSGITGLANGNYVVRTNTWDNGAATNAGAVTWCNAATNGCANQTVSAANSLVGSTANDTVGGGVTVLTNSNFFVRSNLWDNTGAADAGAITFCSGASGCPTGAITNANSLVGSTASDQIGGSNPIILSSGNVVFPNTGWDNAGVVNAGAVTFCSQTTGCAGVVSAANSLVGTTLSDNVGTVTALTNGNYVVRSVSWNGAAADVGAVTFCSGTTGCAGAVSAANSLVGSTAGDFIGNTFAVLTNGNYVVGSTIWDGAAADTGAATWCDGTTGCAPGAVSASNSLVGSTATDNVGNGLLALTNGNYVVRSSNWDNGATANVGAVTWCNGATNSCANQTVTAANSLTGATAENLVGSGAGLALAGGNYVVSSAQWDNGAAADAGAATLCNGATNNCAGQTVSPSNSLIGGMASNNVGNFMSAFPNGNYVVRSATWDNGAVQNAGAITFCNAATNSCANQTVSASNSLVGSTASDSIGNINPITLTNGNLVLRSSAWDNAAVSPVATTAGAITFCHRTAGCPVGVLSAANSLVGTRTNDSVGIVRSLAGGNYVVQSATWDNGTIANAGAVTWCSGAAGCAGAITTANSIIGSTLSDGVGTAAALSNGNYTIFAASWDRTSPPPTISNARFALYGNGATGTFGLPTDAANSDRTVIGEATVGITAAPRFDPINNQILVGRSVSNRVTVLRFVTTTTTALTDGNWENPATWSNGVPSQSNHPIIPNGLTVTLNAAATVQNLTVQTGGNLIFNANLTVNGNLNIGAILSTGANTLALGCDASVTGAGANAFVNGNLKKDFCDIGSFTYPVGTTASGNEYSPVSATVTDGGFDDFPSLTVKAVRGNRAGMVAAQSAQRYFTLTEDGDLTVDLTFNYLDADINGTENDYKLYRFTGATSSLIPSTLDAGMNEISTAGVTDFSTDWAIGNVPLVNTAPTVTAAAGVTKPLGTVASNATIATAGDAESGAGGVEVNVASTNPSNGVTISNIVNTNGTITADISTTCGATAASFTLQASDGSLTANDTLNVAVTANTPPVLTYNNASVSAGGSTTVNPATVSDNGTLSFTVQPGHGLTTAPTVDSNGDVSVTNAQPAGPHTVTIRATDACGLMTDASFTLNVGSSNTAPTANNDSYNVNEDATLSDNVLTNDTDPEMDSLTAALISGPANAASFTLNNNGSFSYTPNANFNGMDSFTYKANDGNLDSGAATVNITINAVNDNPDAINDGATVAEDSGANAVNVLGNDSFAPDTGETLTVSSVTQGANGAVAITGGGTGVSYTPNANFNGSDSFTYTISDGNSGSDTATVNVNVTPVNDNPDAMNDGATVAEDSGANTISVLSNDDDTPDTGETLTVTAITQGANGSVAITGGGTSVSYTPNANFNGGDSFTYTISDGNGGSDTATVNVNVTPVNDNPDAINDSATVGEDSGANTINVRSNDSILPDTGETLTVSSVTQGANGAVAITGGGTTVSYTPNLNFNGMDSFTYTVSDGNGGSDTATVNVTVTPVNDAPTMTGATISRQRGSAGSSSTIAAVSDVDNSAGSLTVTTTSVPAGITVTGITNTGGMISATVTATCGAATVPNTVGLKVKDSGNLMGTANLTVNVTQETTAPVINPIANVVVSLPANSTANSMPVTFPLPTASDNCGGTVMVTTNPVSGSQFNVGTTIVNVTATDSAGNQATSSFTVTVQYRFKFVNCCGFLMNENATNEFTAGSQVPISFSLSGYKGQNIYSSPPASRQISCINGSTMTAFQTINRAMPDPFYTESFDFYTTTWQTPSSWKGSCRRLTLSFNDGVTKTLNFRFK